MNEEEGLPKWYLELKKAYREQLEKEKRQTQHFERKPATPEHR